MKECASGDCNEDVRKENLEGNEKRTIPNASDVFVGEDASFMVVGPVMSLLDKSRRKTVRISFVVNQLRVDIVEDLFFFKPLIGRYCRS